MLLHLAISQNMIPIIIHLYPILLLLLQSLEAKRPPLLFDNSDDSTVTLLYVSASSTGLEPVRGAGFREGKAQMCWLACRSATEDP